MRCTCTGTLNSDIHQTDNLRVDNIPKFPSHFPIWLVKLNNSKSVYHTIKWNLQYCNFIPNFSTCAVKFSRTVSVSFWLCANSSLSSMIFWFRWDICCSRWEILSLHVDLISVSCCLVSSNFFSSVFLCRSLTTIFIVQTISKLFYAKKDNYIKLV